MRFYRLQIESVYLTEDGTVTGTPCKMIVQGAEALRVLYSGQTAPSANGTPHTVAFSIGTLGRQLVITIEILPSDVFDDLVTAINGAIENNSTITLTGTGDYGDFSLEAVPTLPDPVTSSGEFINGRLKKVTLKVTAAS
jgi:hypothetical protein